ncbi:MAG: hypothetical protein OXQ92_17460 [Boseongicola sp.]|nr:hypothetical protein [Boseongicola sp.]MDD9977258.1 hypothetical protein [Boseongicola sp.]
MLIAIQKSWIKADGKLKFTDNPTKTKLAAQKFKMKYRAESELTKPNDNKE